MDCRHYITDLPERKSDSIFSEKKEALFKP